MKTFYFVRHGESEANVTDVHYDPEGPLTERGRRQAVFLGKRFQTIPVDVILASHYERAQETAQIIAAEINKPIETIELLGEARVPSEIRGKLPTDPVRIKWEKAKQEHFFNETWQHAGAENFVDLKKRALELLKLLERRPEKNVLSIIHGWFFRIVIGAMLNGENMTGKETSRLWKFLKTKNTGLTICEYDPGNINQGWCMTTWMDHAHLGEVD